MNGYCPVGEVWNGPNGQTRKAKHWLLSTGTGNWLLGLVTRGVTPSGCFIVHEEHPEGFTSSNQSQ